MTVVINGTSGITDVDGTAAAPALTGTDTDTGVFFPAANTLAFSTAGAEVGRFDSAGNLGLGVTPSAWTTLKVMQFAGGASLGGYSNTGYLNANAYFDGSWRYIANATAGRYEVADSHKWFNAPSGTAGNAITFTQAMTLDASGNLLVGTTSSDARLNIKGSGSTSSTWSLIVRNSASGDIVKTRDDGFVFLPSTYNNTSASAANVFMGGSGELYRSTSSLKYKTNVQDATHGLAEVMQLRPVTYEGKSETDAGKTFGGLIAEEVDAAGLTEFVQYAEDGSPDALAYGNMVSLCIKAIQELKAELDSVKAELAALKP